LIHQIILKNSEKIIQLNQINNILFIIFYFKNHQYFKKKKYNNLKLFFRETFISFYLRFIWRGKAYRVRLFKKNKKFTLNFGHSHWVKLLYQTKDIQFFRLRRQSYLMTYLDKKQYLFLRDLFNGIRPYNKYTKRGIRLKKSFFKQRFGKISQVNSILHSF